MKGEQIPCCQDQHEGAGILASQNKPPSVPVPASRNASTVYLRRLALPGSWQLALKPPISLQVRHCQAARLSKSLVCLRLPRMPRKPDNAGCVSAVQEVMQTLRGHGAGRPSISKDVGRGQQVVRGSGWSAYSGPGSRLCAFAHVRHGHMLPFSWQWCTKFF